jgi:hypothetical protein
MYDFKSEKFYHISHYGLCHNLSLGLATKAQGACKVAGQEEA